MAAFCKCQSSYEKKKLVIRRKDEGCRLRKQIFKNQKWDVGWLQNKSVLERTSSHIS